MTPMPTWTALVLVLAGLSTLSCTTIPQTETHERRPLKVILYPFVPAKDALFSAIEQEFERRYPSIDVQYIDLAENYYDPGKDKAITNTDADVYEVDSVFLVDLIEAQRIEPLPRRLQPTRGIFLTVAEQASQYEGVWYGVPHWACTNFLFFAKGDPLKDAKTLLDVERVIGAAHQRGKGLLIDVKGKSTIGEWYLDALIDQYGSLDKALPFLSADNIHQGAEDALRRTVALCDKGYCRDADYHEALGFYARRFARKDGRALAGYSERLFYVLDERLNSCRKDDPDEQECLAGADIDFIELPLAETGSQPFAWVDIMTIAKACQGQCLSDATDFIGFVTSQAEVKSALLPAWHAAPRYLLPAHVALYHDPDLLREAPLYQRMLFSLQRALPVTGRRLNTNLRQIGKTLDSRLPQ